MQAAHRPGGGKAEQEKIYWVPSRNTTGYPVETLVGTLQIFSRVPSRMSAGYPVAALVAYGWFASRLSVWQVQKLTRIPLVLQKDTQVGDACGISGALRNTMQRTSRQARPSLGSPKEERRRGLLRLLAAYRLYRDDAKNSCGAV
jgi:hypothetical protein